MGTIGSQFLAQDFEECVASVRKAEEAGYSHAWFVDSQLLWQDCFVYITHALAATERIVVGTAVTNPYTRHVTATASMFTTLAGLHPGRVALGIGRGDSSVRTMGLNPVKTSVLEESVAMLRELMAGRHVTINDADVYLRWLERDPAIPIMMPATGPEEPAARRLAGRPRDALRRRRRDLGALGDRPRAGGRRGSRARPGRGQALAPHRHVGERRPGGGLEQLPLGAGCVREPHRRHDEAQHGPRHARDDDAAGAEP